MTTQTTKLITALQSGIQKVEGDVCVNAQGEKYRHNIFKNKYSSTPYFLEQIFNKAAAAAGSKFDNQFTDDNHTFYFNRSKYRGQKHGNITFSQLEILS